MLVKRNLVTNIKSNYLLPIKEEFYNYSFIDNNKMLLINLDEDSNICFNTFYLNEEDELKDLENKKFVFEFTRENSYIYDLFFELYDDIENINVFDTNDSIFQADMFELADNYDKVAARLYDLGIKINILNSDRYKKMCHDGGIDIVSYTSGNLDPNESNYMKITREDDKIILEFNYNDKNYPFERYITIGNDYQNQVVNICFSRFFCKLQEYDPNYHQININELIYNKKNHL